MVRNLILDRSAPGYAAPLRLRSGLRPSGLRQAIYKNDDNVGHGGFAPRCFKALQPTAYRWVTLGEVGWNWVNIGEGQEGSGNRDIWSSGHLKGKDLGNHSHPKAAKNVRKIA
jgi:hypothetical protein